MTCPKRTPWCHAVVAMLFGLSAVFSRGDEPRTERRYLSGHGPKDAVPWEFSVTGGRRAGEKTTIPVPSNWELQGFGAYHYGQQKVKSDEHGLYRTHFAVPPEWNGRRIWLVFDGVMTDCSATVNGHALHPVHEGGFFRFRYDVTRLVTFGAAANNATSAAIVPSARASMLTWSMAWTGVASSQTGR